MLVAPLSLKLSMYLYYCHKTVLYRGCHFSNKLSKGIKYVNELKWKYGIPPPTTTIALIYWKFEVWWFTLEKLIRVLFHELKNLNKLPEFTPRSQFYLFIYLFRPDPHQTFNRTPCPLNWTLCNYLHIFVVLYFHIMILRY